MKMISRRDMLKTTAALGVAAMGANVLAADEKDAPMKRKGRINHSACQWCYKDWDQETFCQNAVKLGMVGIDLLTPDWFPTLKKYNLQSTMTKSHGIAKGLNRKENWDECLGAIRAAVDAASQAGYKNVICFSGNRDGMDDDTGLKNCAEALKQIMSQAEEKKVVVQMELLNSKRNHKDYMCDRSDWGVKLCKAVGSENFKLLYDIYHMQIDEGDVIATIKQHHEYFGHYHTGGVPGRHEIDESQELYYPAIMKAIVDTGYKGIVAQEFIPTRDAFASLKQGIEICDV
jgi:hydroxypyruvate isomerase